MNWAELNPDLLRIIAKKLGDISNFVRFRVVCKRWRLVVGPRDCPPQLPWFLEWETEPKDSSDRKFFSLYSKTTQTLHIPQAKGKYLYGPSSRYCLMRGYLQHSAPSILNPLTRSHFPIPQIENFTIRHSFFTGPDLTPNPNPNEIDNIGVILLNGKKGGVYSVVYWRFANRQWTKIVEVEVSYPKSVSYFQGRLFVLDGLTTETRLFDITTGDEILVIPPPGPEFDCLIEACDDMLGVVNKCISGVWQFDVYHLEDGGKDSRWVKMTKGIGDLMLFLEWETGCGLCLKASDFEGFRGNCIYFATLTGYGIDLCRYDLESKKTQVLPHSSRFMGLWFVPRLY
ncbi:hypothetical protein LUZ60_007129 [Juncus effusus]|nr:hypothetical protein LUZ60_007129 [Juncus effusus]